MDLDQIIFGVFSTAISVLLLIVTVRLKDVGDRLKGIATVLSDHAGDQMRQEQSLTEHRARSAEYVQEIRRVQEIHTVKMDRMVRLGERVLDAVLGRTSRPEENGD